MNYAVAYLNMNTNRSEIEKKKSKNLNKKGKQRDPDQQFSIILIGNKFTIYFLLNDKIKISFLINFM